MKLLKYARGDLWTKELVLLQFMRRYVVLEITENNQACSTSYSWCYSTKRKAMEMWKERIEVIEWFKKNRPKRKGKKLHRPTGQAQNAVK